MKLANLLPAMAALAWLTLFTSTSSTSFAQSTAFSYQGRLNSSGAPANGSYDFQFALFDAVTNGNQLAPAVTNPAVSVSNGLFMTAIDFGNVFAGGNYWLDIAVSTNGADSFTELSPRQPVMPVPQALFSVSTLALQGNAIGTNAPAIGSALIWTGTNWSPSAAAATNIADLSSRVTTLERYVQNNDAAIFVSPAGSDADSGTMAHPVATLGTAIALATAQRKNVYVAGGVYSVSTSLALASGVSLYGQYSGPPNWVRSTTNLTTIIGPATGAILAQNLSAETHVEGFAIQSASANIGFSSYGVRVVNCTNFVLRTNLIVSGSGGAGMPGTPGTAGATGFDGYSGQAGACNFNVTAAGGPGATASCSNGNGGAGGAGVYGSGLASAGSPGSGGASGGSGGSHDGTGQNGSQGANGTNGQNSAPPANALGSIQAGLYVPPTSVPGSSGATGKGGGGGGGGGGHDGATLGSSGSTGNGGGGGGAGGCPGSPGAGGTGGGGSFGVLVVNSTVDISFNQIVTLSGGAGGAGGAGGLGGAGGHGGNGASGINGGAACTGAGGTGGPGGTGGSAGSGAGGDGGPSIGIFRSNSTLTANGNQFTIGNAGTGGAGGSNNVLGSGASGISGASGSILP